jgi:hypothetical protein
VETSGEDLVVRKKPGRTTYEVDDSSLEGLGADLNAVMPGDHVT